MNMWYRIKDMLHLSIFWYTFNSVIKMEKETNKYKRLWILYRLIRKVWKNIPPEAIDGLNVNMIELESKANWDTIYSDLNYYSDRWGWVRLNRIILMYNKLNDSYCFCKPVKCSYENI